jgi:hypothetical protein
MIMQWVKRAWAGASLGAVSLALLACNPDDPNKLLGSPSTSSTGKKPCPSASGPAGNGGASATTGPGGGHGGTTASGGGYGGSSTTTTTGSGGGATNPALAAREVNYTEALRTASFKLVGNAPTLDMIEGMRQAQDPKTVYETYIDQMMQSPRFPAMMIQFWQNTFRSGGAAAGAVPNRDGAPNFAAMVTTAKDGDYRQLFTATSGTCPTFDAGTGTFSAADCPNGPVTAGVLTDAGLQYQYYSNLAFRRVRFVQETFACRKMPAEWRPDPIMKGAGSYTSPWPFESIGDLSNGGRIAFQDTTAAICANCHTTMNHRAPLFAAFDQNGKYVEPSQNMNGVKQFSVLVPVDNSPPAVLTDYLVPGETTAWKYGKSAATLLEFGQQMAQDDEVARCAVVRAWNFAFSKGDAVYDLADVPDSVIGPLVDKFKGDNYNLRNVIRAVFVHDDFVRY